MVRTPRTRDRRSSPGRSKSSSRIQLAAAAILLALVLLLAFALNPSWIGLRRPPPQGALRGYNLLLVTIDTLRADRLGCYGSKRGLTPVLDRLASQGICFERALAHVPLTLPSHTSILTGHYPSTHSVHDNGTFRVPPSQETLSTVLKAAGYRTAAFVGAFVLDARFGLNRGFDLYDDYYGEKRPHHFQLVERRAEAVTASAERWLGDVPGSPWFAWLHLWDPHTPYLAPDQAPGKPVAEAYDAEVAYVDRALGVFLERQRAAGRLDLTLVVITGDHGESLGDHGERSHGTFAYNSSLRVPWLMWAGETLGPDVFSPWVRHIDLLPTVLDLLGIRPPAGVEGRSLRPFLAGGERYETPSSYFEALNTHLTRNWAPLQGIVQRGVKYIDLPLPELYDLERDPDEMENLYEQRRGQASQLRAELERFKAGSTTAEALAPDRETLEKLRTLGYVTAPVAGRKTEFSEGDDPKKLIHLSNLYDEATEAFNRGELSEAVGILRKLLSQQPASSQARQELAYGLHQTARLEEAVEVLEAAVAAGVQDTSLLGLLGAYLLEMGRTAHAATILEEVVRRDPDFAEAHNYLGVAYSRLGRHEEASGQFEGALALDPSSAKTLNNLGSLALARGDLQEAVRRFEAALAYDPEYAVAHNGLGVARARLGDPERAISSWQRAVELDPQLYDALYNLGLALYDRDPGQAAPFLERFLREAPARRYAADLAKARSLLRRVSGRAANP